MVNETSFSARIRSEGKITVPSEIRQKLELTKGDIVDFSVKKQTPSSAHTLDLETEKDVIFLKTSLMQKFREKTVAWKIYPVKQLGDMGRTQSYLNNGVPIVIPVAHKEFKITPEDTPEKVETILDKTVSAVAEAEDRLLFSGEHEGWSAMGIEGLSTATGRQKMESSGSWACQSNIIVDLLAAKDMLESEVAVLILPWHMNRLFHETYWYPSSLDKEPLTVKNYLLKEKIVTEIITTKNLYASDGGVDSALLVQPGENNFYAVQSLPFNIDLWKDKAKNIYGSMWEMIAPVIKNPKAIVEIVLITHTPGLFSLKALPGVCRYGALTLPTLKENIQGLGALFG